MTGFFYYDGVYSRDLGLYLSGSGIQDAPERDVSTVEIPGRNGSLLIDNGRYKNVTVTYPAFLRKDVLKKTDELKRWLLKSSDYKRLEDSYQADIFRMARFSGSLEFGSRCGRHVSECRLVFDCKPQRFLKEGEVALESDRPVTLYNPTGFPALPLIRVYGTAGNLTVGNTLVRINKIDGYLDLDCDTQNALKGTENCNGNIYAPEFPQLSEGKTGISFSGGISRIEIIPRWWRL